MAWLARGCAVLAAPLVVAACMVSHGPTAGAGGAGGVAPETFTAPSPTLRRLLGRHYIHAVRDVLGDAAAAAADPPPDSSLNGFDAIGSAQLAVSDAAVAQYESSALAVAAAAMTDQARIARYLGCVPAGPDDVLCQKRFIATAGRLLWRRPLDAAEIDRYGGVAHDAADAYGDFYAGVQYALAGLLESPSFLYQVELGEPASAAPGALRRLTGYEMATRLSFFLADTTPGTALLDQAASGGLDTGEGVRAAAEQLVASPGARAAVDAFYGELFRLRDLDSMTKDLTAFPTFSPALAQAMREETLQLIEDVVWTQDTDVRAVLDADYTFLNADLAALYGVSAPAGGGFARVPVPAGQKRGGFFGQASFLSLFAHVKQTSPTLRGKFVREALLCQAIPAPPNNVNTTLPPDTEEGTMRDKLSAHQKDPACASCHVRMDNIGFGLENYDALGMFRATENGLAIDAKSSIDDLGGFDGAAQLGELLRRDPDVPLCLIKNLLRASTGHLETDGEADTIGVLGVSFEQSGYRLQELLPALAASDAFRMVGPLD